MKTLFSSKKPEEFPDVYLGQWIRLKYNPLNIYFCKSINGYSLGFSLTTGCLSLASWKQEDFLAAYLIDSIPTGTKATYCPHKELRAGDIARYLDDESWFLVGQESPEKKYQLYFNQSATRLADSSSKDYLVLDKCALAFRKIHD